MYNIFLVQPQQLIAVIHICNPFYHLLHNLQLIVLQLLVQVVKHVLVTSVNGKDDGPVSAEMQLQL